MRLQRPPLLPSIFTLIGICILCGLGTWQIQRLAWKTEILGALEQAQSISHAPTVLSPQIAELAAVENNAALIRYVFVEGTWLHDKEVAIGPRTWKGKTGYHIVTPLMLADGGTVLVNRGWVPEDKKLIAARAESRTKSPARIMGMFHRPSKPNFLTPPNAPAKEEWYSINLEDLTAARDLKNIAPLVLYAHLDTAHPPWPLAEALAWNPPNNHAQYAAFWLTMAGILAVIFALRFVIRR